MCSITHMDSKEIIKRLKKAGFVRVSQVGSHVQFKHPDRAERVTVVHPRKDFPIGTIKSMEKQSGLKFR